MSRVLIVDDAAVARYSLSSILEKHGFIVVGEAGNGTVAIRKYKELKPDIVTMDITMPGLSGVDAVKEIRAIDDKALIVMVSAMGQQEMVLDAIQAGAKGFIVKPYTESAVVGALKSFK